MPDPTTDPGGDAAFQAWLAKQSGGSSDTQLIQGGDGSWYLVNKTTGVATPLQGVPGKSAAPSTKELRQDGNGNWVIVDTATGKATPVEGMAPTPAKPAPTPKTTAPGSPTDQFLAQTDPVTGEITWIPNKNYVPPTAAATRAIASAGTTDQYIVTMNPDGSISKQPNPNWVDPAPTLALKAYQDDLQRQIDAGKLSNQQAIQMFDAQVQLLTAGQNAGQDAVKYTQDANANRVGPNFGQHFADALSGRGVNFQGADFMYQTPDYAAIARQATAQAIAHLSPYAAQIAATQQPPGGYGGSASGAYIPPAGGSANTAMVPAAPVATLPPAAAGQFTAPHPPFPGYGAYRPGG